MANNIEKASFYLPSDIIFDILSRLPVRTLIRFKTTCKIWKALIENQSFVETQQIIQSSLDLQPTFGSILVIVSGPDGTMKGRILRFSEASQMLINSEIPYLPNRKSCKIVGSCNGLVCVSFSFDNLKLIIWNPTTGQFRYIPPFYLPKGDITDIAFFGFHLHASNGYEIVRIVTTQWVDRHNTEARIRAELYNLCTNTWREIEVKYGKSIKLLYIYTLDCLKAMVIDGIFYWMTQDRSGTAYVAYFDIRKSSFDVIRAPLDVSEAFLRESHLQEIDKKLGLILQQVLELKLWTVNEDMSTWRLMYMVNFGEIQCSPANFECYSRVVIGRTIKCLHNSRVLGRTKNGKFVMANWYKGNLKLLMFDMNTRETNCLHDVNVEGTVSDAYFYTEALTLVNYG